MDFLTSTLRQHIDNVFYRHFRKRCILFKAFTQFRLKSEYTVFAHVTLLFDLCSLHQHIDCGANRFILVFRHKTVKTLVHDALRQYLHVASARRSVL